MDDESEEYGGWVRGRWYGKTENRFLFLLASLVIIIFVYPFAEGRDPGDLLLRHLRMNLQNIALLSGQYHAR